MTMIDILEDFAGPGGWDEGARIAGSTLRILGREINADAVATARAAGHERLHVSVLDDDPAQYRGVTGYIASPPCQTFSQGGKGSGRAALQHLTKAAHLVAAGHLPREAVALVQDDELDERSVLCLEPLRVVMETSPQWVALEQVPGALPVFESIAEVLRDHGYHVRTGVVNAEEYGVPQARRRAILVAVDTTLADEAPWPAKTHSKYHRHSPARLDEGFPRWVSMDEALGRPPATAVPGDTSWTARRPSTTIVGTFRPDIVAAPGYRKAGDPPRQRTPGSVRVTVAEAGILQSFPADYPWQGSEASQFQRVGDAMPPLLAAAVLAPLFALTVQARQAA